MLVSARDKPQIGVYLLSYEYTNHAAFDDVKARTILLQLFMLWCDDQLKKFLFEDKECYIVLLCVHLAKEWQICCESKKTNMKMRTPGYHNLRIG